jgi:exoribonuclease R
MKTRINSRTSDRNYDEKNLFEEYLSLEETIHGVGSGAYLKGILRVSSSNWRVSHVTCEGLKIDVQIGDEIFRNRALHEDLVAILLLPRSDWFRVFKRPLLISANGVNDGPHSVAQTDATEDDSMIQKELWQVHESLLTGAISRMANSTTTTSINSEIEDYCRLHQVQPTGKVVHIMVRQGKLAHNGSLMPGCHLHQNLPLPESVRSVIFKPFDTRYPQMTINRSNLPAAYITNPFGQMDQIHRAEMTSLWPAKYRSPPGTNVRSVGMIGSIEDETRALLVKHDIFHQPHSSEMLQPLREMLFGLDATANQSAGGLEGINTEKVNWIIPDSEISKRRDLRSYRIFTIDPYNAKDLDDALHITPLEDGTFEIG